MTDLGIVTHEDRYRLLLEISRIANAPLELDAVVEGIGRALGPLAAVDSLVLLTIKDGNYTSHKSIHMPGVERQAGDTFRDIAARALNLKPEEFSAHAPAFRPLAGTSLEHAVRIGKPYVANYLGPGNFRFENEPKLIQFGIHAYIVCPVIVHDKPLAALAFARMRKDHFTGEEAELLGDISTIVGTAVANALAYEKIRDLKDQLQTENILLREQIAETIGQDSIVGKSEPIQRVLTLIERVGQTDSTVLICGETGTGKELVARAVHRLSSRSRNNLVQVNCAALPPSLIASELFGHERGAFTGAVQRRVGRFELASGSSLFLDEIGELPMDVQASLLRVLQEHEFERVGGSQTIQTNVRLITATNRDLDAAVAAGTFRSDLFYRLNVFPIHMPALRDRREDIPLLVDAFVTRSAEKLGRRIRGVDRESMDRLMSYDWPGNIRELQNVIERAAILADDGVLRIDERILPRKNAIPAGAPSNAIRHREREMIEGALAAARGKVSGGGGAAEKLGLPASTLESKIRAHGIDKHRYRSPRPAIVKKQVA